MAWAALLAKPEISQIIEEKKKEVIVLSPEERIKLYGTKFVVRDFLKTFSIKDDELLFANQNTKMYCEIEMECIVKHDGDFPIYYNYIRFRTPPSRKANECGGFNLYTIGLEFFKNDYDDLLKIENFEDFVGFLEHTYRNKSHKLNYKVFEHQNKDSKLCDLWTTWNKIFKPRFRYGNALALPIIYPPVFRNSSGIEL